MQQRRSAEECARDRALVNAIREIMGLDALYGSNGSRETNAERFYVDVTAASDEWRRMHGTLVDTEREISHA